MVNMAKNITLKVADPLEQQTSVQVSATLAAFPR